MAAPRLVYMEGDGVWAEHFRWSLDCSRESVAPLFGGAFTCFVHRDLVLQVKYIKPCTVYPPPWVPCGRGPPAKVPLTDKSKTKRAASSVEQRKR